MIENFWLREDPVYQEEELNAERLVRWALAHKNGDITCFASKHLTECLYCLREFGDAMAGKLIIERANRDRLFELIMRNAPVRVPDEGFSP